MYKYIVLCLCVGLSGVLCDLNLEEGADCEWDGVKGKCVKETQCFTTLDKRGDPHLVCSVKGDVTIVCCTDCELVNDTRNVVMSPSSGYHWKDGTKARDSCLEYLDKLPYRCRDGGFYSGISKYYSEEKKCHTISMWAIGGAPSPGHVAGIKYPHLALLGFGHDVAAAKWLAAGSIISNKYILTAANIGSTLHPSGPLKFVGLGIKKFSDGPSAWQTHKLKRFIRHPEYTHTSRYHDIALIEVEDTITFNKNVLPACLHVIAADDQQAITTTWIHLASSATPENAETPETITLEKFSGEQCSAAYPYGNSQLNEGINYNTQMCYGTKTDEPETCRGFSGEPLVISTQFSRCVYAIIGVNSFSKRTCGNKHSAPDVFTRVAYYKPWIESVVWGA